MIVNPKESNDNFKIEAIVVDHVCNPINGQEIKVTTENHEHLKTLKLAENESGALEIDILVGVDYYWDFLTGEVIKNKGGPTAMNSVFGWVLSGPTMKPTHSNISINHISTMEINFHQAQDSLENQVKKFWDLETLGIREVENDVIEEVVERITLNNEGRYEVSLPFKEDSPIIPDNFKVSENRLMTLYNKLKKNPKKLQAYNQIMKEQMSLGVIEPANEPTIPGQVHYLPHHAVHREEKETTKVRIVYDASSTPSPTIPSLNDCLYKGPQLNPLLYEVLLLFRTFPVALTSDIEKAFLQISINPKERDFVRFLWFEDVFADEPKIVRNRFARLLFGVTSSPFLLTGTMRKHLSKYNDTDPKFVEKATNGFHVDDFTGGDMTTETAYELFKKLKIRFAEANFNLRKWRTNDPKLRQLINESSQSNQETTQMDQKCEATKQLGVLWNENTDELLFDLKQPVAEASTKLPTKRNVLKIIASFYDPLGVIQPVIVSLKVLFQQICKSECEWDETIPQQLQEKWNEIINELQQLETISIPRPYTKPDPNDPVISYEIHGFSDASQQAYGACVYLRSTKQSRNVSCSLISSKTRVAPLKQHTIPRLELLGNTLLAELTDNVFTVLSKEISIDRITYWTDSQITLAWIKSPKKEFKTFVENRLRKIRKLTCIDSWRYVATKLNPADLVTRFINPSELVNNRLWYQGPDFLIKPEGEWPAPATTEQPTSLELKLTSINTTTISPNHTVSNAIEINRFSSLKRLYRVTAWVLRFIRNIKERVTQHNVSDTLTTKELEAAELLWIKDNQISLASSKEFENIKKQLNVFTDSTGVYHCKGRLQHAPLPYQSRAPILITRNHRLAELIVTSSHEEVKHMKTKSTLTQL